MDRHQGRTAYTVQVMVFARQAISCTVGFWTIPFGDKIGFQWTGLTYAMISIVMFIPVFMVMRYGDRMYRKQFGSV